MSRISKIVFPAVIVAFAAMTASPMPLYGWAHYDEMGQPDNGTLSIGPAPRGIEINPKTNTLYIANSGSNTISVINATTYEPIANLTTREQPVQMALDIENNLMYVTHIERRPIVIYNLTSLEEIGTIDLLEYPWGLAYHPAEKLLYISGSNGTINSDQEVIVHPIWVFDPAQKKIVRTIYTQYGSGFLEINPSTNLLYDPFDYAYSVINITSGQTILTRATDTTSMAVNPQTDMIYATAGQVGAVLDVYNATTLDYVGTVETDYDTYDVAIDAERNLLYATVPEDNLVLVIDGESLKVIKTLGHVVTVKERCADVTSQSIGKDDGQTAWEKIGPNLQKMIQAGHGAPEYRSITIFLDGYSAQTIGEDASKELLECLLLNEHSATQVSPARVLSFLSATVPVDEIPEIASYQFVSMVSDAEETEGEFP